jgi:hypothetical protein
VDGAPGASFFNNSLINRQARPSPIGAHAEEGTRVESRFRQTRLPPIWGRSIFEQTVDQSSEADREQFRRQVALHLAHRRQPGRTLPSLEGRGISARHS